MFNFFKKQKREPQNLKEILGYIKKLEGGIRKVSQRLAKIEKEHPSAFQKLGIVRFNPFKEMGGDQSFSLALLDKEDNGLLITSLYTREGNRVFAKPLAKGISKYQLSEEEKEAIRKAQGRTKQLTTNNLQLTTNNS